mmetsp:Transcript_18228/g.48418  ORF Transcript_18228/g.48418 Transcript_18228/m.48418 type:complete len:223 (+) Transcript_18228:1436-2104(+)
MHRGVLHRRDERRRRALQHAQPIRARKHRLPQDRPHCDKQRRHRRRPLRRDPRGAKNRGRREKHHAAQRLRLRVGCPEMQRAEQAERGIQHDLRVCEDEAGLEEEEEVEERGDGGEEGGCDGEPQGARDEVHGGDDEGAEDGGGGARGDVAVVGELLVDVGVREGGVVVPREFSRGEEDEFSKRRVDVEEILPGEVPIDELPEVELVKDDSGGEADVVEAGG